MPPATSGAVPAASHSASARDHLRVLLDPVVAAAGYDLEDLTVSSAGRRSVVRVIVDADGGVDLDAVAAVSRLVSETLDADAEADRLLRGAYVLEVSSPGVDRPLTEPRHWRRATGRLVAVELAGHPVTGRVVSADEAGVRLDVAGKVRGEPWSRVGPGRVQVEFNRSGSEET
ncbi:MAG TPA: ribosome maturation factor RimP [Jatrophihabitans sp.]|nr:ribosome maturation factor RimP [Jatrophihabitans sp.]